MKRTLNSPPLLDYRRAVADEVASWMGRRRTSRRDLAKKMGVNHSWLSRRLDAEVAFDTDDLLCLAELLGCDMGDFLPEHRLFRKPLPTTVRERLAWDTTHATEGPDQTVGTLSVLPRLDSNQQPSGYPLSLVSEGACNVVQLDDYRGPVAS